MRGGSMIILALFLMIAALGPLAVSVKDRVCGRRLRASLLEPFGLLLMASGLLILAFLLVVRGQFWILEAPFVLATGWVSYLGRVLSRAEPDAIAVGSALACVVAVAVVAHLFLRWLASTGSRPWSLKRTLLLLLLVVLLFASGVAVTGVVQQANWLIRTPEPLTKDAHRIS